MNVLAKKGVYLPATLKELTKFVLIGREKLVAVRAEIRAIDKLELATGVREQKRDEAQLLAGALLDAEAKLGEILKSHSTSTFKKGGEKSLPKGITRNQSSQFQKLAEHKDIVEQVKAEAIENDDLPTRTEVLKRVKEKESEKTRKLRSSQPLPEGVFNVIYADPPWEYDNRGISGAAINHYSTMSTEKICALQVPSAKNAVLFLWVTNPFIKEGILVCESWGFEYKTNIVWIKERAGQGFYVKGQHELLFVATKGQFLPDNKLYVRSVIEVPKGEHSEKPEEFRKIIETLYPAGKNLEMFGRKQHDNWVTWGNEIGSGL